jgi:hypothetical protein
MNPLEQNMLDLKYSFIDTSTKPKADFFVLLGRTLCQRKNPTIPGLPIPAFFRLTPLA